MNPNLYLSILMNWISGYGDYPDIRFGLAVNCTGKACLKLAVGYNAP